MCGISGFCNFKEDLRNNLNNQSILSEMGKTLTHRGPDTNGTYISKHVAFAHTRLAVVDILGGLQPMSRSVGGFEYTICYNGELYNTDELRNDLKEKGYTFTSTSDTEVLLYCYVEYHERCPEKFNGIFAFAIWDSAKEQVFVCRDRFGVKPLFYTFKDGNFIFGSEIKALLKFPGVKPVIDRTGLCEVFGIGPARTAGNGVFKDIYDIKAGHYAIINKDGFKNYTYFKLKSEMHKDSYEETIENVGFLLRDAIKRQLVSDVPLCTFLSGGLDSSIITAIAAKEKGAGFSTFSFDYKDNSKYFKANSFQPDTDRPWVEKMVAYLNTNHTFLECDTDILADYLYSAVDYKDLPGMADIDSSLIYFCSQVKNTHTVALSGECADEVFGGYPWFHSAEAFNADAFPWSRNMETRNTVLSKDLLSNVNFDEYAFEKYDNSIKSAPILQGEGKEESRRREISYLNIEWFMATLLDRKDRASMASGLEVRVPYADHRLVQYVFNIPWDMKCKNGVVKNILREGARGVLPDEILFRRKSPYPKTYNPNYEKIVCERLREVLENPNSPILPLINKENVLKLISSTSDYGKPWFGQLMAGPQQVAYLLQVNYWLDKYGIEVLI